MCFCRFWTGTFGSGGAFIGICKGRMIFCGCSEICIQVCGTGIAIVTLWVLFIVIYCSVFVYRVS